MLKDGPDYDWGCVGPDELFVSSGPTPSLLSLAARVERRDRLHRISKSGFELRQITGKMEELWTDEAHRQTMKADCEGAVAKGGAMSGDKQPDGTKMSKRGAKSLKQLAFEVEKFVAVNLTNLDERQTAEQRMVIALGAKPPRRKAINYRKLKEQRTERKMTEGGEHQQQERSHLKAIREGKVRKKKETGRKRKNGSGVLKKWKREKRKTGGRKCRK